MNANLLRRVNWLWKHRHTHDDDNFQEQITVLKETVETQADTSASTGSGAFVHLERTATQSIGTSGAEAVSWDAYGPYIQPAEFSLSFPTDAVSVPRSGYYNVAVRLEWSSFQGGGTVYVAVVADGAEQTVWPPADSLAWTATDGQQFEGVAPAIPLRAGDTVKVYVDHGDVSSQNLAYADLALYLVDRVDRRLWYEGVILDAAPVAYWRLDETSGTNADETAGHASGPYDGTYVGTPTLNQTGLINDGSASPSVDFNGSTQYVTVPQAAVDGLTNLTVEAWVHPDVTGTMAIFFVNWQSGGFFNRYGLWMNAGTKFSWFEQNSQVDSTFAPAADTTNYVAVTRTSGGDLNIYVNGVLDSNHSVTANTSASGDTVQIGVDNDDSGSGFVINDPFNGRIDEVAVYDRVLTAEEIAFHYAVGVGRVV